MKIRLVLCTSVVVRRQFEHAVLLLFFRHVSVSIQAVVVIAVPRFALLAALRWVVRRDVRWWFAFGQEWGNAHQKAQ